MDMNFKKGQLVRIISHNSSIFYNLPYNFNLCGKIGIYLGKEKTIVFEYKRYNILVLGRIYKFYSNAFKKLDKF